MWDFLKWLGSDEGATGSEYFGWTSWPSIIEHASHPGWASRFEGTNVQDAIQAWAEEGHNFLRLPGVQRGLGGRCSSRGTARSEANLPCLKACANRREFSKRLSTAGPTSIGSSRSSEA